MKDIFEKIYEDAKHDDFIFLSHFQFYDQYGTPYIIGFPPSFFKFSDDKHEEEEFELRAIPIPRKKNPKELVYYTITNCGINHSNGLIITPVLKEK